jgi:hypothetical protein
MNNKATRSFGFLSYPDLYYVGEWTGTTVSITLTTNIWVQITNASKNLYQTLYSNGFHLGANDKIVSDSEGLFNIQFQPNGLGQDNKDWAYRIIVERASVQIVIWEFLVQGSGKTVLCNVQTDYFLHPNDLIWVEMRSPSITPGTVDYYRMHITIKSNY